MSFIGNIAAAQTAAAIGKYNAELLNQQYKFEDAKRKSQEKYYQSVERPKFIDDQKLNLYVDFIINALFDANKYFNDQEPWKKKSDKKRLNTIVFVALELIRKISIMLYPIVPSSSIRSLSIFNINEKDISFETIKDHKHLKSNSKITKVEILFKKIIK